MMKGTMLVDEDLTSDSTYWKDWLGAHVRRVKEDEEARGEWVQGATNAYRMRYMLEWRRVEWPWPGASDIVMPLIDMMCDKLKPSYLNLITAVHPPVTVLAADRESQERASSVELWFDWLVRAGSPNFVRECAFCIDDILEVGFGLLKSFWHYETRVAPETVSIRTLDKKLLGFVVPTKKQLKVIDQLMVRPEIATGADFDRRKPEIEPLVESVFDLDPENKVDALAKSNIMAWLRSGCEEPLTFKKRDRIIDAPAIASVHPTQLIVPSEATSVEDATHLTQINYLSDWQMRARVTDAGWNPDVVDEILQQRPGMVGNGYSQQRNLDYLEQEQAIREGVGYRPPRQYTVYESCTRMDIDRDGEDEKVIVTWCDQFPDRPLKTIAYNRPSQKWPYHRAEFEINKRRWYAPRGVPMRLADLQKEWTIQHRSKLNRMLIANAPTFVGRMNSMLNWQTQRWIPGQILWSLDPARDIMPLPVPNLDMSFKDEENYLRTVAEAWTGAPDYGNVNPMSSLTEPRTATEIRGIQQQTNQALSIRGTVFQLMMSDVYREMWDLWQTWGTVDVWSKVTDSDWIRLSKENLQGQYLFQCTGRIGEADPFQEAARSLARLQVLMQAQQAGVVGGPGSTIEINWEAAFVDYLEKDDMRIAHRIITKKTPEQIEQEQAEAEGMAAVQGYAAAKELHEGSGGAGKAQQMMPQQGGGGPKKPPSGSSGGQKNGPRLLGQSA